MSVGEYADLAHAAIDELVAAHSVAVVAGGTGLYLRAALAELDIPPAVDATARERLERLYDTDPESAHARLVDLDPAAAASVHVNDRRRVVRALELAELGSTLTPPDGPALVDATRVDRRSSSASTSRCRSSSAESSLGRTR